MPTKTTDVENTTHLTPAAAAMLRAEAAAHPRPLLFATVSGAHLYGFPSPDSDYDLRGTHVLPVREVIRLDEAADAAKQRRQAKRRQARSS